MENVDRDWINRLPDDLLQVILALAPTKSVITTSALSTRWRRLSTDHLLHTTNLDFGKGFSENQSPEVFTRTVNRVISLNTALKIDKFRLRFDPGHHFRLDVTGWISFATSRSVKELSLDFCRLSSGTGLPKSLFNSESLTHLKLSYCTLGLPLEYSGLGLLRSLRLDYVHITDSELEILLANSPLIETLVFNESGPLKFPCIFFSSRSLKHLTLFCWLQPIDQIVINAPNLHLLSFRGKASKHLALSNIISLKEAVIEVSKVQGLQWDDCYKKILTAVSEVKILTVYADYLPHHMPRGVVDFNNLKELRFANGTGPGVTRFDVHNFFRHCFCPILESLSIELSPYPDESSDSGDRHNNEETVEYSFEQLKTIEISNFQQMDCQMELVRYFLESSSVLKLMILVAPLEYDSADEPLEVVNEKPYHLPNTHSTVPIIYRQYLEDTDLK